MSAVSTLKFNKDVFPKCGDGIANSVDPDQTAPLWVCPVCPNLSVPKLRVITGIIVCFITLI